MAEYHSVLNPQQRRSLLVLRLVWGAMVVEVVALAALIYAVVSKNPAAGAPAPVLMAVATIAVVGGGGLGYFLRMQAYKKSWVASRIERQGYFTGNLLLLGLIETGAVVAAVCAYLSGRAGQELFALFIPLLLLALNFPNGRAMLHEGGRLPERLDR